MRARAVIGANFGDEGKGLVTDYLCATEGAGMVVRFNGGAQAGHTVVTPHGKRHVFSHVGSGAFEGVPTFLSQFFVCNPLLFFKELNDLENIGINPIVYAHPQCIVTTFADMMINQRLEDARGKDRHGSVGVGVNETIERSKMRHLCITMADVWNKSAGIEGKIVEVCNKYAEFRTGKSIENAEPMIDAFMDILRKFGDRVHPLGIWQCKEPIFEGAQGLLLDQNNKAYFPHLTRSNTGMQNVRVLCEQSGIDVEAYYVSRTYLTRHGAGPLPVEDATLIYYDNTNTEHNYQGKLRFARLDENALRSRCREDYRSDNYKLVLTHCDQERPRIAADLFFDGPTRSHARQTQELAA